MPPQGYYGKARVSRARKKPARTVVRSGPPKGRPGSGIKRPPTIRPPRTPTPSAPQVAPPSAAGLNQGLMATANSGLAGGGGGYNVASDPAVAAAQGLAAKMRATAQAQAQAKRVQAAIEYGDPTGVEGIGEQEAKAAKENPFSILKNLEHSYSTGTRDLEEGLNKANLHYSGYRGQQLGEASRGYQDSRYQAATRFKGLNTDISDQLANALLSADSYEAQSLMNSDGGSWGGGGYGGDSYGDDGVGYSLAGPVRQALGIPSRSATTTVRRPGTRLTSYSGLAR
jgi:hypothetical protein